jgi:hypothetical protein
MDCPRLRRSYDTKAAIGLGLLRPVPRVSASMSNFIDRTSAASNFSLTRTEDQLPEQLRRCTGGTAAGLVDSFVYAASAACGLMVVSYSIGVNFPRRR